MNKVEEAQLLASAANIPNIVALLRTSDSVTDQYAANRIEALGAAIAAALQALQRARNNDYAGHCPERREQCVCNACFALRRLTTVLRNQKVIV